MEFKQLSRMSLESKSPSTVSEKTSAVPCTGFAIGFVVDVFGSLGAYGHFSACRSFGWSTAFTTADTTSPVTENTIDTFVAFVAFVAFKVDLSVDVGWRM